MKIVHFPVKSNLIQHRRWPYRNNCNGIPKCSFHIEVSGDGDRPASDCASWSLWLWFVKDLLTLRLSISLINKVS